MSSPETPTFSGRLADSVAHLKAAQRRASTPLDEIALKQASIRRRGKAADPDASK